MKKKSKKKRFAKGLAWFVAVVACVFSESIPIKAADYWPQEIEIASPCAMVMEMNTGAVLYEKNVDEVHYPASITKIMTTMLAIENGNMDDIVTFSADAVYKNEGNSSHISRDLDEQMTLEQCLYATMLESANECAYAVAEHIGGGDVSKFIDMMNEKAKALGCTNTHFNNPNGLPDENHYTSTRDMTLIAKAAYEHEMFRKIVGTGKYVIPPTNKHDTDTILRNHHSMLYPLKTSRYLYDGCTGGKTGYTIAANSTLVTFAERDGMSLVCVVMNTQSPNHYLDTTNLFNYCFDNFQLYNVKDNEAQFAEGKMKDTGIFNEGESFAGLDENGAIILPKTATFQDAKVTVNEEVQSDTVAGRLEYTYAGHAIGGVDILVTNEKPDQFQFDNATAGENNHSNQNEDSKGNGKGDATADSKQKTIYIQGNWLILILIILVVAIALVCIIRLIVNHMNGLKMKLNENRIKPDPRYTVIRDTRKKWWKRRR